MSNHRKTRPLNRLRLIFDRRLTVANALDKAAAAHGDNPLFRLDRPPAYRGLDSVVSARQLQAFANRLANALTGQWRMQRHDRVAIVKENAGDYFFFGLAIMRAGGVAVPVNGGLPAEGLRRYLEYTGTRILITDRATLERVGDALAGVECLQTVVITDVDHADRPDAVALGPALERAAERFEPVEPAGDDDVLLVHTSGTTGFPKAVIHTSGSLVAGIKGQLKIEPVFKNHVAMSASPFNHFINYLGLMSAMLANVPTWLMSTTDPAELLAHIDRERIAVVFCFPHTYLGMYQHGLDAYRLDSVRLWLAGADSSHEVHVREFTRHGAFLRFFGKPLIRSVYVDTLGSSEVGFAALFRFTFSFSRKFDRYVGKPTFAGPAVKVADAAGRPLPAGRVGRLMVKGPTLFKGYWNAHDKLHGVVIDGWWWTGDVAMRDRLGRYYHYDRHVDVIHTRQGAVYTLPIEETLLKYPGVAETVVVAKSVGEDDAAPVALVQPMPGAGLRADTIRDWANERLSGPSRLAEVHLAEAADIPRGLTGKVLKRQVRDRFTAAA